MQTLVLVHKHGRPCATVALSLHHIQPRGQPQSGLFIQALISVFETLTMFKMDKL